MKIRKINKTYYAKLLISLTLILITAIIFISVLYFINLQMSMEKQLAKSSLNSIQLLRNSTEKMLLSIDDSLMPITLEPEIVNFTEWAFRENRDIVFLMDFLSNQSKRALEQTTMTSRYVYYFNDDTVLDLRGGRVRNLSDMDFNKYLQTTDVSQKDGDIIRKVIKNYKSSKTERTFFVYRIDTKYRKNVITLVKPVGLNFTAPTGLLITTLEDNYFTDVLKFISTNKESSLYILDRDYKFISEKNALVPETLKPCTSKELRKLLNKDSDNIILKTNHGKIMLSYTTSALYGWKFLSVVSTDAFFSDIRSQALILFAFCILSIFAGMILVIYLSKNLYRPITGLQEILGSDKLTAAVTYNTDIQDITHGINKLKDANKSLETTLNENIPRLKQDFLNRLLNDTLLYNYESVWERLEFYHANIKINQSYTVCMLGLSSFDMLSSQYSEKQTSILNLYQSRLVEHAAEAFPEVNVEVIAIEPQFITILISLDTKEDKSPESLLNDFLVCLHETCYLSDNRDVNIGVGRLITDFDYISRCYKQAKSAYGYKIIRGNNQIITFDEIPQLDEWYYEYPNNIEKQIFYYLRQGLKDDVRTELGSYFNYIRKHIVKYEEVKFASIYLLERTIQFCGEIAVNILDVFPEDGNLHRNLIQKESVKEINLWFEEIFNQLIDYINNKKENQSVEIMNNVIAYIDKNFTSPDISMDSISMKFHFSISYLSKNFKDATGKTMKEYITGKRILYAQTLLSSTDYKIKDIGEMTGYPNTQSFINIYKKMTGETPGEYQRRVRNADVEK